MDQIICINTNSFPANCIESARELFSDAIQGVLELQNGNDRFLFYLDCNKGTLHDLEIAVGYTFGDFINNSDDPDLAAFLLEIEDKSPAIDSLSEEQLDEITQYSFYVPGEAVDSNTDVFGLTWTLSGYLLSLNTQARWNVHEVRICRADGEGLYVNEVLSLKNIATAEHGRTHFTHLGNLEINQIANGHIVSPSLTEWYSQQTKENQVRVAQKLELACQRDFCGGKPLFDNLHGDGGYREIRFSAYSGGAIRIIFKQHVKNVQALLCGFIKKSNNEGYEQALRLAEQEYTALVGYK
ncbi:type II toxin-antitoxin system RelE/ParE family toxin [Vibrio cholerae]|nr:type II toxin-antitoxin system RelE/ParE family toxin [Vibrio cholerae]